MNVLKKIIGFILLIIAAILSTAICYALIITIIECIKKIKNSVVLGISYTIGSLLAIILFIVVIVIIAKLGLKLIRKKELLDSIDEIGKENL